MLKKFALIFLTTIICISSMICVNAESNIENQTTVYVVYETTSDVCISTSDEVISAQTGDNFVPLATQDKGIKANSGQTGDYLWILYASIVLLIVLFVFRFIYRAKFTERCDKKSEVFFRNRKNNDENS